MNFRDYLIKYPILNDLYACPQDSVWHQEGSVGVHTEMVFEQYKKLFPDEVLAFELAIVFHDIGKLLTTKHEDGEITSKNHANVGANMALMMLWNEEKYSTKVLMKIYNLIKFHMKPPRLVEKDHLDYELIRMSQDVNLRRLYKLSMCDLLGRKCEKEPPEERVLRLDIFKEEAENNKCFYNAFQFHNSTSKLSYSDHTKNPYAEIYEDDKFDVYVMCGLPGSGKDTYIQNNLDYPVVSLDAIRKKLKVSFTDNQGAVIQAAIEEAKTYLRKKQTFVWNSTNLNKDQRSKSLNLVHAYGAKSNIVVMGVSPDRAYERNTKRESHSIPAKIFEKMKNKYEPPSNMEAHNVLWFTPPSK